MIPCRQSLFLSGQSSNMKILIVDDEPLNIGVLANALKGSYEICTAENGYDALRMV